MDVWSVDRLGCGGVGGSGENVGEGCRGKGKQRDKRYPIIWLGPITDWMCALGFPIM